MFLFASCVRALGRLLEPRVRALDRAHDVRSEARVAAAADLDAHYLAERDDVFRVVTDRDGWPGTRSLDDSAVVVIGDSFAFGYGVDAGKQLRGPEPGVDHQGGRGARLQHGAERAVDGAVRRAARRQAGGVVRLPGERSRRTTWRRRCGATARRSSGCPARAADGRSPTSIVGPTPWQSTDRDWKRILPHLCVPGPLADRAYAACDYLIGRASASCRRVGRASGAGDHPGSESVDRRAGGRGWLP